MTPLAQQLRTLGVTPGDILLTHASFRATRPVEGGPAGLVDALLEAIGTRGTLVMPSWSGLDDEPFDPQRSPAAPDLGVVADTFWRVPGALRGDHPFAFAALGPDAARITADPLPLPPHTPASPVGRVYDLDGKVLLLGVGHDANSTLHLAEVIAGVPYGVRKHCTVLEAGSRRRVEYRENDHCCARFALADEWLRARGLQSEGPVSGAHARLARSRDIVACAVEHLKRDPLIFLHPRSAGCVECDAARDGVPSS